MAGSVMPDPSVIAPLPADIDTRTTPCDDAHMMSTRTFAGKVTGSYQYLFFVLFRDYTDFARSFIVEFNDVYLERFARDLKGRGAVFLPFRGDVEETRDEVLSKDWTADELVQVSQVPSLLVISKDFDEFSPRRDPWVIFHFGEEHYGGPAGLTELDKTLSAIVSSVVDPGQSPQTLYQIARQITRERPDLGLAFAVQPNIFGFSIDLLKAGSYLRGFIQDHRRPVGRQARVAGTRH